MFEISLKTPMWMDEYVFYRLSSGLPSYSTSVEWLYQDRPAMLSLTQDWDADGFDSRAALSSTYNSPIYPHTPLATIIV